MLTRFLLRTRPSRTVIGPSNWPSLLPGFQLGVPPSSACSGRSSTRVSGITPCSKAVAYRKGLKLEPGCRRACVARLKGPRLKLKPPTSARTRPVAGSSET